MSDVLSVRRNAAGDEAFIAAAKREPNPYAEVWARRTLALWARGGAPWIENGEFAAHGLEWARPYMGRSVEPRTSDRHD